MNILIMGGATWFERKSHAAQSFYRIAFPLKELTKHRNDIRIVESASCTMPEIAGTDCVFIHNPTTTDDIRGIATAKAFGGVKIWLDFDDLTFNDGIPLSNIAWTMYNSKEITNALSVAIPAADVISVSTQTIKDAIVLTFKTSPDKIHVIPNALPDSLWEGRAKFRPFKPPTAKSPAQIMWRGSVTHEGDLYQFRSGLIEHPAIAYHFHGAKPWVIDKRYGGTLEHYSYRKWDKGIAEYFASIHGCNADYFIVPLEILPFNHAKSNIAWLEATYAGAGCIATELAEFSTVPCNTFRTAKEFGRMLKAIGDGADLRTEKYIESVAIIKGKYLLSVTNKERIKIIDSL